MRQEQERLEEREVYLQSQVNDLWLKTVPQKLAESATAKPPNFPEEPEENILYFIEKNAPLLEPWQREVVRIVRKVGQYFYPQRQTQVMNEGWACFWHYHLINELYDRGRLTDGFMLEFIQSHTNVIAQPDFDSDFFNGINPYALGYAMMTDIKRICVNPDAEDRRWFPEMAGSDWQQTLDFAMRNFKDESFISQYLSPRLMREFKLFSILDDAEQSELEVTSIHNDDGYRHLRQVLSNQFNLSINEPNIQVYNVDIRGDRSLTLRHVPHNQVPLSDTRDQVLKHMHRLWGFGVRLETVDSRGEVISTDECSA
jgi:spore cortex formation protein SpoVR/YcgB (stage V sporulation)